MSDLLVTQADHSKYQWHLEKAQKPGGQELTCLFLTAMDLSPIQGILYVCGTRYL